MDPTTAPSSSPDATSGAGFGGEDDVAHVGAIIGRYKLLERIGEGGFGVVFMAEQQHPVRRRVALKVIKPGLDTRQVVARFEAERQALALMDHENIAKVLDGGATPTGRPYFVMELVRGVPITDFCDRQRLSPRERLELFAKVCHAAQHAHTKGIIHRDIKPTNILVSLNDDDIPVLKVIDFGIAKATAGQQLTDKTLVTQLAQMIGTPMYMSPEQAEMSGLDVDTRSDIYSLGVVLYELLTGTTPFDTERLKSAALDEVRRIIREEEPPRPSTRISTLGDRLATLSAHCKTEPHRLGRIVRGELDWIVMKALEKDRTRRYESAGEMARDVERYLRDEPVRACPPSAAYRMKKFVRKNALAVGVAAGFVLLLAAAAVVSTVLAVRATRAETRAIAQAARADEQAALARRLLYTSQMNLAQQALRQGDGARTLELLESQRPRAGEHDPRQFEWYHLWQRCHEACRFVLAGHAGGPVMAVAYAPDGKLLASGGDGGVVVWDATDGEQLWRFPTAQRCTSLAFSPEGTRLAAVDGPSVRVLDTRDRREQFNLAATTSGAAVTSVAYSTDGNVIAAGATDSSVTLWDARTGDAIQSLRHDWPVACLAFSPDGTMLATNGPTGGGNAMILWRWDGRSATEQRRVGLLPAPIAFAPDSKTVVAGSGYIVETATGKRARNRDMVDGRVWTYCNVFSPDGSRVASARLDRTAVVWDVKTGANVMQFPHTSRVYSCAFAPDGARLAMGCEDGRIKVWDLAPPRAPRRERATTQAGYGPATLTFLPDGEVLALACDMPEGIILWNSASESTEVIQKPRGHIALSGDGKTMAISGRPGQAIRLWDVAARRDRATAPAPGGRVTALAFSPDGQRLAVADDAGNLVLSDPNTGQRLAAAKASTTMTALAFSPDGKWLVTTGAGGTKSVRDPATAELVRDLTDGRSTRDRFSIAFAPDSRSAAIGNDDGVIRVYDTGGWTVRLSLRGHTDEVFGLAFFPDGRSLLSGSNDRSVRIWDAQDGRERMTLSDHGFTVSGVAINAHGNTIAAASPEGAIHVWRAATTPEATALKSENASTTSP